MATYKAVMRSALEYASSIWCCYCLLTPMTLASGGGESDFPACGPPASFSVHLASSAVNPAESPQINVCQRGAYVGAVDEMLCV